MYSVASGFLSVTSIVLASSPSPTVYVNTYSVLKFLSDFQSGALPTKPARYVEFFVKASRLMSTPRMSLRRSLTVLNVFSSIPPKIPTRAPIIILTISSVSTISSRR